MLPAVRLRPRWSAPQGMSRVSPASRVQSTRTRPPITAVKGAPDSDTRNAFGDRIIRYVRVTGIVVAFYMVAHIFAKHFYEISPAYGISMLPTIASHGEMLVESRWYRRGRGVQVGDLVSYKHPVKSDTVAVKRVIGMSGDFVQRDTPGKGEGIMIQVPEGHCWVVGDNLTHSRDSRIFGPLPQALINGKIIGRLDWKLGVIPWLQKFDDPFVTD